MHRTTWAWAELQAEFDYAPLRDALAAGEFQEADDITRAALIQLAGPGAVKRNWVYFTGNPAATPHCNATMLRTCPKTERAWLNMKVSIHCGDGPRDLTLVALICNPCALVSAPSLMVAMAIPSWLCPACAEVKFIAAADLQTMDALWSAASGGKFGYRCALCRPANPKGIVCVRPAYCISTATVQLKPLGYAVQDTA